MIAPTFRIVLTAPQWLVVTMLAFVIAACLFRIGLDLYVTHVRIEDFDQTRDDADTDETTANVKIKALRPVPHKREEVA